MALPDASITASLHTEEQCVAYLESLRWPGGVACPNCGGQKISRFQAKGKSGKTRQICQCLDRDCKYQFSATTGTIFHDSHLPLTKWFEAMRLLADPAAAVSVNQLRFVLEVQYKTAKNVAERIQRSLAAGTIEATAPGAITAPAAPALEVTTAPAKKPRAAAAKSRAPRIRPATPPVRFPAPAPVAPASRMVAAQSAKQAPPPTVVDSMLSVFTSAMNLSVKPPLAAVNYLKKRILK